MQWISTFQSKFSINLLHTVDYGFIQNVHPFFAVACEEDGEEHAQKVMKFDKAVNEHDGYEDPDKDPTSHHLDRAVRLSLHENQFNNELDALRVESS